MFKNSSKIRKSSKLSNNICLKGVSESMTHMIIITVTYYISSVVVLGVFMLCE
ncbi:hypothetical protein F444_17688 [Phytophthora nicotianae P1976]|uniref:Uncharacterized protein n=1 Tax=Phytophthora nicotianae P1976 TaxID=1317066 RepID=A0A080ZE38_PHYNI|nr:hypothetical protein F444_17688 [Phytophthora nicotianae P1976]